MTKGLIVSILFTAFACIDIARPAVALPRVLVNAELEISFDAKGYITAVTNIWHFDQDFTNYAIKGVDTSTPSGLKPLADVNIRSLKEFKYFTSIYADNRELALGDPIDYHLEYNDSANYKQLTLFFTIPLESPLLPSRSGITVKVFDQEYFVAFHFNEGTQSVRLKSASSNCSSVLHSPNEPDEETSAKLSSTKKFTPDLAPLIQRLANSIEINCEPATAENGGPSLGTPRQETVIHSDDTVKLTPPHPPKSIVAGRRIALVIGNSAYASVSPLRNSRNDADLVSKTLRSLGFEVTELVDADYNAMRRAMVDLGRAIRSGTDASLFYYSGHGIQVNGHNYLVPVDASLKDELEASAETLDIDAYISVMQGGGSQVNIVVLDACRNNPFATMFRSASRGLSMVRAPSSTFIAYSTAPDNVAEDGDGLDSPYTLALVNAISQPDVKIEDAFKNVRRTVMKETNGRQVPWESSSITEDFYFVPSGN
jgi:ABC-type uncharacterized transport system substrate-binding protein